VRNARSGPWAEALIARGLARPARVLGRVAMDTLWMGRHGSKPWGSIVVILKR
jgi:hypothetical protein